MPVTVKNICFGEEVENQVGSLAHTLEAGDKGRGKLACPEGIAIRAKEQRPQLKLYPIAGKKVNARLQKRGYRPPQFRHYLWKGTISPAWGSPSPRPSQGRDHMTFFVAQSIGEGSQRYLGRDGNRHEGGSSAHQEARQVGRSEG